MNWTRMVGAGVVALCIAGNAHAQSPRAQLLVDANWLKQHINDKNLVLLHVGDKAEYDKEHLPGARFIRQQDVAKPQNPDHNQAMKELSLELATPEAMRAKLESLGVSDNSRIIVYYGKDWVSPSTRIVFSLDHIGLGDRTSLLDGGMPAYKAAGGTVTADLPNVTAGKLSAKPTRANVVQYDFVREHLKSPEFAIIDARTQSFYDAVDKMPSPRPGHIAGAKNLPFNTVADDDNKFLPADELKAKFAKAGFKPGQTIIAYCHIGQQATAVVFAARTLGYKVVLYDGSYTDWETHPDALIETL